ncbi:MAG: hypothetical protein LUG16_00725 [Candidatus Gastranaerophilales bacterium]|nr:hypothetical protein [Candidatus Gastranaerophilales bacterium]
MSYKLEKPYTRKERCDFIVKYNHQQGLTIEEGANALYALEAFEKLVDDEVIDNTEEYTAEKEKKEKERINNLTMTALDFITGLTTLGLSLETINEYLENNLELKMQLTYCQNVYCSVVKQLCPLTVGDFTLTEEIAEAMFLYKADFA